MNGYHGCTGRKHLPEILEEIPPRQDDVEQHRRPALMVDRDDPVGVVQRWRDAVTRLEAICEIAAKLETPDTATALDLADAEATEAFGALAAAGGLHRELLRAQADALEWQMQAYGALSDGPQQEELGRSIIAKLRALAGSPRGDRG